MPRQDDDSSDSQPHPAGDRPVRMRDKSHLGTKNYGQLATWTNTTTVPGTTMSHVSTPSSRLRVVGVDGEGLVERRHATQSRSPSARLAAARSSRSTVPRGCRSPTPFGRANRADGTGHQGGPWSAGSAESPCSGRSSVMVVWMASWCPFVTTASPRLLSPGCCRPAAGPSPTCETAGTTETTPMPSFRSVHTRCSDYAGCAGRRSGRAAQRGYPRVAGDTSRLGAIGMGRRRCRVGGGGF